MLSVIEKRVAPLQGLGLRNVPDIVIGDRLGKLGGV